VFLFVFVVYFIGCIFFFCYVLIFLVFVFFSLCLWLLIRFCCFFGLLRCAGSFSSCSAPRSIFVSALMRQSYWLGASLCRILMLVACNGPRRFSCALAGSGAHAGFLRDAVHVLDPRDNRGGVIPAALQAAARMKATGAQMILPSPLHRHPDYDPDQASDHRRLGRISGLFGAPAASLDLRESCGCDDVRICKSEYFAVEAAHETAKRINRNAAFEEGLGTEIHSASMECPNPNDILGGAVRCYHDAGSIRRCECRTVGAAMKEVKPSKEHLVQPLEWRRGPYHPGRCPLQMKRGSAQARISERASICLFELDRGRSRRGADRCDARDPKDWSKIDQCKSIPAIHASLGRQYRQRPTDLTAAGRIVRWYFRR